MAKRNLLLLVDGIVNLALGVLLIFLPAQLVDVFDLPKVETFFYVNILGAILTLSPMPAPVSMWNPKKVSTSVFEIFTTG